MLTDLDVSIPELAEQKKVGGFFFKLDRLIDLKKQTCDKLQNIKKALPEKMFPAG